MFFQSTVVHLGPEVTLIAFRVVECVASCNIILWSSNFGDSWWFCMLRHPLQPVVDVAQTPGLTSSFFLRQNNLLSFASEEESFSCQNNLLLGSFGHRVLWYCHVRAFHAQPAQVRNTCSLPWWSDGHRVGVSHRPQHVVSPSVGVSTTLV